MSLAKHPEAELRGNRLTSVNGVTYTLRLRSGQAWDNNGNLLSDGASTNTYNHANRLTSVVQGPTTYTFAYNGLGDRLRQTINGTPTNYTVDLAAGLTQVLADGSNTYIYGVARIGEKQTGGWQYHLGDALGSFAPAHQPRRRGHARLRGTEPSRGDCLLTSAAHLCYLRSVW